MVFSLCFVDTATSRYSCYRSLCYPKLFDDIFTRLLLSAVCYSQETREVITQLEVVFLFLICRSVSLNHPVQILSKGEFKIYVPVMKGHRIFKLIFCGWIYNYVSVLLVFADNDPERLVFAACINSFRNSKNPQKVALGAIQISLVSSVHILLLWRRREHQLKTRKEGVSSLCRIFSCSSRKTLLFSDSSTAINNHHY